MKLTFKFQVQIMSWPCFENCRPNRLHALVDLSKGKYYLSWVQWVSGDDVAPTGQCAFREFRSVNRPQRLLKLKAARLLQESCFDSLAALWRSHYNDVIMSAMASRITSLAIVYSTVYSSTDQRKHQSSASLPFVRGIHRWPVNSPHKGQ